MVILGGFRQFVSGRGVRMLGLEGGFRHRGGEWIGFLVYVAVF